MRSGSVSLRLACLGRKKGKKEQVWYVNNKFMRGTVQRQMTFAWLFHSRPARRARPCW